MRLELDIEVARSRDFDRDDGELSKDEPIGVSVVALASGWKIVVMLGGAGGLFSLMDLGGSTTADLCGAVGESSDMRR